MTITHANRGKAFEELISKTNEQYLSRGVAVIQKVSTPTTVVRRGKEIVTAFHSAKSTVDYSGVYAGKALAFDAKSTREPRWSLGSLAPHQHKFLEAWEDAEGYSFVLVEFVLVSEVYLVPFHTLHDEIILNGTAHGSITLDDLRRGNFGCKLGGCGYYCNYLEAFDRIFSYAEAFKRSFGGNAPGEDKA